ncbi:hypothetical protein DL98DRAFT_582826 [Cadophora sp. DSE1049]|nr:hypothetical protein DL98DRAFT_582826 [Cadophora sp. DSE1049]
MATIKAAIAERNLRLLNDALDSLPESSQIELDDALQQTTNLQDGFVEAVEPLLALGANITNLAFINAVSQDDMTVMEIFTYYGWNLNSAQHERTALCAAIRSESKGKWNFGQRGRS